MSIFRILVLSLLGCFWCVGVLGVRLAWSGEPAFLFMLWNLFLAAIPLGCALVLTKVRHWAPGLALIAGWLLFFPNAPYVLTDLLHLRPRPGLPLWFDLLVLMSFALVSLWLGFQSLRLAQHWVAERTGAALAWGFVMGSLLLSGFGIYLGRFLRWNSWDIVSRPDALLADIFARFADPLAHVKTWTVTFGFGGLLMVAYLFWVTAAAAPPQPARVDASK
jgi:uncharacterized membrane protein